MKLPVFNIAHEGTSHDIDVRKKTTLMTYTYICTVRYDIQVWVNIHSKTLGLLNCKYVYLVSFEIKLGNCVYGKLYNAEI